MRVPVLVTLVEAQPTAPTSVLVTLGDSITEGGSLPANAFHSWPDRLADRLTKQHWAVVNAGISGNRLLRYGAGPSALARLDRDVLSVPGIKAIILMEGINDIVGVSGRQLHRTRYCRIPGGCGCANHRAGPTSMASGHRSHLNPYQGASYASPAGEAAREAVNTWIKTSGAFDGVIDFAPWLLIRPIRSPLPRLTTTATTCIPMMPDTRPWAMPWTWRFW